MATMRVLALGGSGGVGRHACRLAVRLDAVEDLVVADVAGDAASVFARSLGPRARSLTLDISDGAALLAAMRDADVVINSAGPFFRFGVATLSAAIQAGCQYLDVCDDWEATLPMLDLHPAARTAGVTAVIGLGASPGLSNLLAVLAARELDSVDELVTGWNAEAARPDEPASGTGAAVVHALRQLSGTIRVVRGGRPVDERPLRRVRVDYPGVGRRWAWTFGHPEPLTLPRVVAGVTTSVNVVSARPGFIALLKALGSGLDHGVLTPRLAARVAGVGVRHLPVPRPRALFDPDRLPPLFGLAAGTRAGHPAAAAVALTRYPGTSMGAVTGVPLAVGLQLLAAGSLAGPGVFAPEAIVDPDTLLAAFAAHVPAAVGDLTVVTRSWDPLAARTYRAALDRARASVEAR
jgi:saccharopine dehydrogenase-like NADP-dependent oxidoreductase